MRKIVAAMATLHAQQFYMQPLEKDPKRMDAEPRVGRGAHPVGCLMTLHVLQAEQRLIKKSVAAH